MDKLSIYRQTIAAACPDLQITSAALHTADGQFNDIVLVNHELIFRFPRTPQVAASYAAQAAVLTSLQGKLPLPIPSPLYAAAPDAAWQQRFLAYRRIPGEPLYREALAAIHDPVALRAMAGQLGAFLRSLHHLALDNLPISAADRRSPGRLGSAIRWISQDAVPTYAAGRATIDERTFRSLSWRSGALQLSANVAARRLRRQQHLLRSFDEPDQRRDRFRVFGIR
jgi:hypothetical protein